MEDKNVLPKTLNKNSLTSAKNELSDLLNKNTLNSRQKATAIQKSASSSDAVQKTEKFTKKPPKSFEIKKPISFNSLQKPIKSSSNPYKINVIRKPSNSNDQLPKSSKKQNNIVKKPITLNNSAKKPESLAKSLTKPPSKVDASLPLKAGNLPMPPLEGFVPPAYRESKTSSSTLQAESVSSDDDVFYDAMEAPEKRQSAFKTFSAPAKDSPSKTHKPKDFAPNDLPFGDSKTTSGEQKPPKKYEASKTSLFADLFKVRRNSSAHLRSANRTSLPQQSRSIVSYMMPTQSNLKRITSTISTLGGFLGDLRAKLVAEEPQKSAGNAGSSVQKERKCSFSSGELPLSGSALKASDSKQSNQSNRSVTWSSNRKIIYYDSEKEIDRDEVKEETRKDDGSVDDGCQDLFRGFTARLDRKQPEVKKAEEPVADAGFRSILRKLESGSNFDNSESPSAAQPLTRSNSSLVSSIKSRSKLPSSFQPPKIDSHNKMLPEFSTFLSRLNAKEDDQEEGHSDSASEILKKKTSQVIEMGRRCSNKVVTNVSEVASSVSEAVSSVSNSATKMVNSAKGSAKTLGETISKKLSESYIRATAPSPTPAKMLGERNKTMKLTSARNDMWSQSTYSIPSPLREKVYFDQSLSSIGKDWMEGWSGASKEKEQKKPEVNRTESIKLNPQREEAPTEKPQSETPKAEKAEVKVSSSSSDSVYLSSSEIAQLTKKKTKASDEPKRRARPKQGMTKKKRGSKAEWLRMQAGGSIASDDESTMTSYCDVTSHRSEKTVTSYCGSSDGDTVTSTDFLSEASRPTSLRSSVRRRGRGKREIPKSGNVVSKIDEMMRTVQGCYDALDV